jgi:hypothetical protein
VVFARYNYNDEAKETEIDRTCSRNGDKWDACRIWYGSHKEKTTRRSRS